MDIRNRGDWREASGRLQGRGLRTNGPESAPQGFTYANKYVNSSGDLTRTCPPAV